MERMINCRHDNFNLTNCSLLCNVGSVLDIGWLIHSVIFETFCRQCSTNIYFHLEKTYDPLWKYGIMKDLLWLRPKRSPPYFCIYIFFFSNIFQRIYCFPGFHPERCGVYLKIASPFSVKINRNLVLIARYMSMVLTFVIDRLIRALSKVSFSFTWVNFSNGHPTMVLDSLTQSLYVHPPEKKSPLRSTALSGQRSQFQWWKRPTFFGLYLTGGYPLYTI